MFTPNFTARSFASLLGLILKPIKTALEAFAKDTSVSVMAPTDDKTISGLTGVAEAGDEFLVLDS